MASFITTIELHGANEKDYQKLSAELKKELFKEGRHYNKNGYLSRKEEFSVSGNVSLQQVADTVVKAAAKTGRKYSFTIIKNKPLYN